MITFRHTALSLGLTALCTVAHAEERTDASRRADMMVLTVDKSALKAELHTWPEDPAQSTTLGTFRIAIGKAEGDKEHEGDNRTPEGIYFAQSQIDGQTLPAKYGTKAIPIDFPNPIDQVGGKTGHGIWLHGVDRDQRIEEAKVTEGCVAFYNSDIAKLANWLRSYQGLVVIAKDVTKVNQPKDLADVRSRTVAWIKAWAGRQIDAYASFYAPTFRFENFDLKGYRDYKRRVFTSYKQMTVNYDRLRVISHPKYAISFFNQDFRGDSRYVSDGRKILYWEKGNDGQWRIKREVFEKRRFETVSFTDAELALLSPGGSSISSDKDNKGSNL